MRAGLSERLVSGPGQLGFSFGTWQPTPEETNEARLHEVGRLGLTSLRDSHIGESEDRAREGGDTRES